MINNSELQLFITHIDRLRSELKICKDPEHKKSIEDEIIFFTNIIDELNKNINK